MRSCTYANISGPCGRNSGNLSMCYEHMSKRCVSCASLAVRECGICHNGPARCLAALCARCNPMTDSSHGSTVPASSHEPCDHDRAARFASLFLCERPVYTSTLPELKNLAAAYMEQKAQGLDSLSAKKLAFFDDLLWHWGTNFVAGEPTYDVSEDTIREFIRLKFIVLKQEKPERSGFISKK